MATRAAKTGEDFRRPRRHRYEAVDQPRRHRRHDYDDDEEEEVNDDDDADDIFLDDGDETRSDHGASSPLPGDVGRRRRRRRRSAAAAIPSPGQRRRPVFATAVITPSTRLYCLCAALNSVNLGYDLGVSTSASSLIQSQFELSQGQLEAFLGCINLASIFGALFSPTISDVCGRRATFLVAAVGFVIGVVVVTTATSYGTLVGGRIVVGLAVGCGEAIDPMYIAESEFFLLFLLCIAFWALVLREMGINITFVSSCTIRGHGRLFVFVLRVLVMVSSCYIASHV